MIGRRTAVGLSLLCALLFSAIVVQSASAAKAENTTAFTCVPGGGNKDFSDAHCDTKVTAGTGDYGHQLIPLNANTPWIITNETTGGATDPAVLAGKAFGAATEITCNTVSGEGELESEETPAKRHTVFAGVTIRHTNCSVQKPAKCDVEEPIEFSATAEGFEESGNMGLNFKPASGETFVTLTYDDNGAEQCSLDGSSIELTGSALATAAGAAPNAGHSGATLDFDHTKLTGRKTLLLGGVAAGLENTVTMRMAPMPAVGNPITFTTTT